MGENLRQRYKIRVEKSTTHFLMARRLLPATDDEIFSRFYPVMFAAIRFQNLASGGGFAVAGPDKISRGPRGRICGPG